MKINLGSIEIPINAATKTLAILGKRGSGKSYAAAVFAEELFKNSIPFVVFDPIDVWWGLRLSANGKDKGLPIVVFGIQNADIQLDREMGRRIAQAVVKENISCVISTFGMPKAAQRHLIAEFSDELLNINNTPRQVLIEEAHEYLPQRVFGGLGVVFNAVSNLVVMGRNKGIGVTLINQRAATINKDVLTQLDTLLAFRNVSPQDRKALRDWVEYHAAEGDFEKFMESLPSLPTGEGWIWSPEFLEVFKKIKIRKRETFHPDREKIGDTFTMPELTQIDVQSFIEKFSSSLKKETPKKEDRKSKPEIIEETPEDLSLHEIKNQYESQLIVKEGEIRDIKKIIEQIRGIVGVTNGMSADTPIVYSNGNASMWIEKLGANRAAGKILSFLAGKSGMKFTRSQICLACGLASKGGNTTDAFSTLKRNNLIVEQGKEITVNPNL